MMNDAVDSAAIASLGLLSRPCLLYRFAGYQKI